MNVYRLNLCALQTLLAAAAALSIGCGGEDVIEPTPKAAEAEFYERATGVWQAQLEIGDGAGKVYATDTEIIKAGKHRIEAEAFFDAAMTQPFLKYEADIDATVVARSADVADGYQVDLTATSATMTALVDDPALFAAFGLDDCNLVADQAVDVSNSDCGVPLFRDTRCTEMDLYAVAAGADEIRVGELTDKCAVRPAALNPDFVYKLIDRTVPE